MGLDFSCPKKVREKIGTFFLTENFPRETGGTFCRFAVFAQKAQKMAKMAQSAPFFPDFWTQFGNNKVNNCVGSLFQRRIPFDACEVESKLVTNIQASEATPFWLADKERGASRVACGSR